MVLYLISFEGIFETCTVTGINVTEDTVPVPELPDYKIIKYSVTLANEDNSFRNTFVSRNVISRRFL